MGTASDSKKATRLFRALKVLALLALLCGLLLYLVFILPFWGIPFNHSRHGQVPQTPPWALECWLWEDDVNTATRVDELLEGYAKYDLPVRTILIDSPWSYRYNDFKVDEARYPEPEKYFHHLKEQGYRVVLWMTCMVNSHSKDTRIPNSLRFFGQARAKGFLAGNGYQWRWWKGKGGFIDYSNPDAMQWWHGLQKEVLDWGVDGWKLDGCDTFFSGKICGIPVPFNRTHSGWMTTRQYMDHYARDEYQYGLTRNPEFAILVRALDQPWSHPEGKSQFTLWHPETHPNPEQTTLAVDAGPSLKLEFSGKHEPHILRILLPAKPARVLLDGAELPEGDAWQFDPAHQRLIIKTRDYAQGQYEIGLK
jgi:hypothetical protein